MEDKTLFSIIVPVYNSETFLENCIHSIIMQTYQNYEVIIINDGSTDGSINILKKYEEQDKRVKVFSKENGGLSSARNYGISKATGDYIVFLDSDDYISDNYLETIWNEINKFNPDIVRTKLNTVDLNLGKVKIDNDLPTGIFFSGMETQLLLMKNKISSVMSCLYVYKRKYWIDNNFNFELNRYHEDYGLILLVLLKASRVVVANEAIYYYCIRENSIMTTKDSQKNLKKAHDKLYFYNKIITYLKSYNGNKKDIDYIISYFSNGLIVALKYLRGKDFNSFAKELRNINISDKLLDDSFSRKVKKIISKISLKLYVFLFFKKWGKLWLI